MARIVLMTCIFTVVTILSDATFIDSNEFGKQYLIMDVRNNHTNYNDARDYCESRGYRLVQLMSEEEEQFVDFQLTAELGIYRFSYWLGFDNVTRPRSWPSSKPDGGSCRVLDVSSFALSVSGPCTTNEQIKGIVCERPWPLDIHSSKNDNTSLVFPKKPTMVIVFFAVILSAAGGRYLGDHFQ